MHFFDFSATQYLIFYKRIFQKEWPAMAFEDKDNRNLGKAEESGCTRGSFDRWA